MKFARWRTDYGRGPMRVYVVPKRGPMYAVGLRAVLRHPIKSFRFMVLGISGPV
jgi:hypothetical protein